MRKTWILQVAVVLVAILAVIVVELRAARALELHQGMVLTGQSPALLENRLRYVSDSIDGLQEALDELHDDGPPSTADEATVTDLDERVAALEAVVERLSSDYMEWSIIRADSSIEEDRDSVPRLAETRLAMESLLSFQAIALDGGREPETRLHALRMLHRFPEEMAALAPVATTLPTIYDGLSEPRDREDLIDTLSGQARDPHVRSFLLDLLDSEQDPSVRIEAVRELAHVIDDSGVRSALVLISDADPSSKVRRAARTALER